MPIVLLPLLGFLAALLGLLVSPVWLLPAALAYLVWAARFAGWLFSRPSP
ncbi:MAG: hypothetical protein KGZ43_10045 [Sulfuritalea sp.]|nr:hypothetical protein [Sulfuritalea sp.]